MTTPNKKVQKMSNENPVSKETTPTENPETTIKATRPNQPFVILPYEIAVQGHRRRTEP